MNLLPRIFFRKLLKGQFWVMQLRGGVYQHQPAEGIRWYIIASHPRKYLGDGFAGWGENNVAEIEDRVTFYALKGTNVKIGNNLDTDDNIIFHGPLEVGNNLTVEDDAVLFRSKVGNDVFIGTGAIVVGVTLRDGARIPDNAVITTQNQVDALRRDRR